MKDLLSKEHCCYKIRIFFIKISAFPLHLQQTPPPRPPPLHLYGLPPFLQEDLDPSLL